MDIQAVAEKAIRDALPSLGQAAPAYAEDLLEEVEAGEWFSALISLMKVAPAFVSGATVDALDEHLAGHDDPHSVIAREDIARYRSLATA